MEQTRTSKDIERAILVGLSSNRFTQEENATEETLDELELLLETAGGECVAKVLQHRQAPDAHTFIGEGKVQEIQEIIAQTHATMVVFDNTLSPSQMRTLEEMFGVAMLDRSALILDIFAQRAKTGEGKLQVELAQYQYILPRLMGLGKMLSRQGGGIGTRGPGESKLETDKRHIRTRIDKLRASIEQVRKVRSVQRRQRKKSELPLIALIGYTNAGKSTLFNQLTGADVEANNRLFDTLDPTTRKFAISETQEVLLSDTVGFIHKLPHHLISAFEATLEELKFADLLLHVVDASCAHWQEQVQTVNQVITKLGASTIPCLLVLNKMDQIQAEHVLGLDGSTVCVSAKTGMGMDALLSAVEKTLGLQQHKMQLCIPYAQGHLIEELHHIGSVQSMDYQVDGVLVYVILDNRGYAKFARFQIQIG